MGGRLTAPQPQRADFMPRLAAAADVNELVRVINLAYRVEDFFINGNRTHDADIRMRMAKPHAAFLVVDDDAPGRLAGAVYVEVRGVRGYFGMLSVDPPRQKLGLGRLLIESAESHCRSAGCEWLDIDVVNLRDELPAFYAQFGFAAAGEAPFPDPHKLTRDAHLVIMSKRIEAHR